MVARTSAVVVAAVALVQGAAADELKNAAFQIQSGPSGVTSLRRTNDVADTEYVAPNGSLGRLIVRYRTAPHGDWKELHDLLPGGERRISRHDRLPIVTDDPVFGLFAYGGILTHAWNSVSVIPRDGLRVRFDVVRRGQRLHLELDHDAFAKEQPVVVADDLSRIQFTLENRTGPAHTTGLTIEGLPTGDYQVTIDGRKTPNISGPGLQRLALPVGAPAARVSVTRISR